jgi:hypothetical protein
VLLKGPEVRGTRSKDTIGVKRFGDEVSETEMGRRPSTAGETTVQPLLGTVGSVGGSVAVSTGTACQRIVILVLRDLPIRDGNDATNKTTTG